MATACTEIHEWIEEQIEQRITTFAGSWIRTCREQRCEWRCLCCNKWVCWLAWVVVAAVAVVVVTVSKWVTRIICEVTGFLLDAVAFFVGLTLSIPIVGGFTRAFLNWLSEIGWRAASFLEFVFSGLGIRLTKRMYVGVVIPSRDGKPIATAADIEPQLERLTALYKDRCNVKIVNTGVCAMNVDAPHGALSVDCGLSGFFSDFWLGGSYIELSTTFCKFRDGWRRVTGFGAPIIVFVVENVTPDVPGAQSVGCSFISTHNYVAVEKDAPDAYTVAHEIGHACWLGHSDDPDNLMTGGNTIANPTLNDWQVALIRWSKHCVYF